MRLLFDQGTPVPLRAHLSGHTIDTIYELGWSTLKNGALLAAAEQANYDILLTTDQQLRFQQNLTATVGRRLAVLVLKATSWPRIRAHVALVQYAIDNSNPGSYTEVDCSPSP